MDERRVTLIVEGLSSDGGHVRLDAFLTALEKLRSTLIKLDALGSDGKPSSYFTIVGLSHNSPATVEIEARPLQGRRDVTSALLSRFGSAIKEISAGRVPEYLDYKTLADLREIASPVGSSIASARISVGNEYVEMTKQFAKQIEVVMAEEETCFGSVDGMLEQINVHADANTFTIYPEFGAKSISCHFPKDQQEKAVSAIKRRVSVSGNMHYRKNAPFPHHIDVDHLEIYALPDDLPSLDDLRGLAPNATGGLASEDFVRELRNAW